MSRVQLQQVTRVSSAVHFQHVGRLMVFPYRIISRPVFMLTVDCIPVAVHKGFTKRSVDTGDGLCREVSRVPIRRLTGSEADVHGGRSRREECSRGRLYDSGEFRNGRYTSWEAIMMTGDRRDQFGGRQ